MKSGICFKILEKKGGSRWSKYGKFLPMLNLGHRYRELTTQDPLLLCYVRIFHNNF